MAKVNISVPDGLMRDIDALAKRGKVSRSAFMQEAAGRLVAQIKEQEALERRRRRIESATSEIRGLSAAAGSSDGVAQIRRDRERRRRT